MNKFLCIFAAMFAVCNASALYGVGPWGSSLQYSPLSRGSLSVIPSYGYGIGPSYGLGLGRRLGSSYGLGPVIGGRGLGLYGGVPAATASAAAAASSSVRGGGHYGIPAITVPRSIYGGYGGPIGKVY